MKFNLKEYLRHDYCYWDEFDRKISHNQSGVSYYYFYSDDSLDYHSCYVFHNEKSGSFFEFFDLNKGTISNYELYDGKLLLFMEEEL